MTELVQITRFASSEYYELIGKLDNRHKAEYLEPQLPLDNSPGSVVLSASARSRQSKPDCETCGACCVLALIVTVNPGDEKRLKEYWDITTDDFVIERVLGRDLETGRCVHLDGDLSRRVSCSIYPDRPDPCRAFEAGSDRCLEYRRMCGIDPQLTEEELEKERSAKRLTRVGIITNSHIAVASVGTSIEAAADGSGGFIAKRKAEMCITVAVDKKKDEPIELHRYDPSCEEWHETEFYGLTLDEARSLIREREVREVNN